MNASCARSNDSQFLRWQSLAALLLLAVLFAQLLSAATQLSTTIDEGFHITSGYAYLRTGRMRLMDEHVPLVKALFAWPLFFVPDLTPPEQAAGWAEGDLIRVAQETVLAYQPIDRIIVACRIPVALLTLLVAATVYRWAANWFGPTAGMLALVLLTFDPNVLAHGSLATTDLGAVAFIFWAVWAFARHLEAPTRWRRWWVAALLLGLAQGAKLTASLLLPVLGLLALVSAWIKAKGSHLRVLLRQALSYGGMVAVAGLVLWALYLFEVRSLPEVAGGALPLPAASHIERWLRLQANIAYGRESFLLGQNRMHGWWQYFPVAFVLKTPLPVLLLLIASVIANLKSLISNPKLAIGYWILDIGYWGSLTLFPLTYGALSLVSTINIGYRHLLPILPFLYLFIARLAAPRNTSHATRFTYHASRSDVCYPLTLYALLACYLVGTLRISPHYLAYFNSIAGGADQGYRFLADSNTDWGQTLKTLAEHQRRNDLGSVKLSLFTFLDPAVYGVVYEPIAPMRGAPPVLPRRFSPEPGLYAISATTLDGVPLPLPSMYDWFRHRTPLAKVGHVMFLYEVQARSEADEKNRDGWVAQCTVPVAPLTAQAMAEGFGSSTLRQVYFDCEQSWVFPDGGTSAGWYVQATPGIDGLHWPTSGERLEWWPAWTQQLSLAALHLSYVQPTPGELPAFAIWEWTGASVTTPTTEEVTLGETLVFLGYAAPASARPGTTMEVLTYWRVLVQPSRPLSLMLHLIGADGIPITVGDGLGVPIDQWQRGDIIVQRHQLPVPEGTPPGDYELQTGAYWLDIMERWAVTEDLAGEALLLHIEIAH